jgi:two-component system chemotaxis sensor kinase CheA
VSDQDPIAAFRVEAGDLLDQIEQALLDLSNRLDDRGLIDAVFRGLHTLKGSGAMFGFDALATFTHHCETAFDRVRKGLFPATAELVHVILSAMDHMRALVDGDGSGLEATGAAILGRLQAALPESGTVTAAPETEDAAPEAASEGAGDGTCASACRRAHSPMAPTRSACSMNCASWANAASLPCAMRCRPWPTSFPPNA